MAAVKASDVLVWIKDARKVAFELSENCEAAGPDFDSISHDVDKLEKALRAVKKELKIEGSPFFPNHGEEYEQIIQGCHCSFQDLNRIIQSYKSYGNVSPNDSYSLTQVGLELRRHIAQLKDVQRRTKMAASMGVLYGQLKTIGGDIESGRRDPNVLSKIVDLDALSREISRNPPNTPLSPVENKPVELPVEFPPRIQDPQASGVYELNFPLSPVESNLFELPVVPPRPRIQIQIPQACEVHELDSAAPSPSSRSPVVYAQPNEPIYELPAPPRIPQILIHPPRSSPEISKALPMRAKSRNYTPPTVEDCNDEDSEVSADLPTSGSAAPQQSRDGSVDFPSDVPPLPPRPESIVGSTRDKDTKLPKQTDAGLSKSKEEKYDIQKEVNKYKERLQELEHQRLLENFRKYRRRWSVDHELGLTEESGSLPDGKCVTFFIKPSGEIVEKAGESCQCCDCKAIRMRDQHPQPLEGSSIADSSQAPLPGGHSSDSDFIENTVTTSHAGGQKPSGYMPPVSHSEHDPHAPGATSDASTGHSIVPPYPIESWEYKASGSDYSQPQAADDYQSQVAHYIQFQAAQDEAMYAGCLPPGWNPANYKPGDYYPSCYDSYLKWGCHPSTYNNPTEPSRDYSPSRWVEWAKSSPIFNRSNSNNAPADSSTGYKFFTNDDRTGYGGHNNGYPYSEYKSPY